jgi:ComF family protein
MPFPYAMGDGALSAEAVARPPLFDRARAVAVYDGPARDLVTALKFNDRTDLVPLMATWMARAGAELLAGPALVVPVPLHRRRLLSRKHNQSALLANAVARLAAAEPVPDLLVRTRPTRAQVGLTARQREANVRAAFAVAPRHAGRLRGARIVLVDDVFTTGATVTAATRALLRARAASVDVLTFARVVAATDITI